jgi:hypothetical protein
MQEPILQAGEQLIRLLDYQDEENRQLIKKGLALYRQGYVYNLKELEHYTGVVVHDEQEQMVLLNLNDLSKSECGCNAPFFCTHRLAGFFYAYSMKGLVGHLLDQWKQLSSPLDAFRVQRGLTTKEAPVPSSIKEWLRLFEERYDHFSSARLAQSTSVYQGLYDSFFKGFKKEAPAHSPYRELFVIHAGLAACMKLCDELRSKPLSKHSFNTFVRPPLSQILYDVEQCVHSISQTTMPFSADRLLDETREQVRRLLFYSSFLQYERIDLYRTIWSQLLKRPKWLMQEKQMLQEEEHFPLERDAALAHLLVLEKRDEQAVAVVQQADPAIFPYTFKWAKEHIYYKDEQQARLWIIYIQEKMKPYIQTMPSYQASRTIVSMLLSLFEDYSELGGDQTVYEEAMRGILPYSFVEYSHHLYEQRHFKAWLELQAAFRYDMLEYDRSMLKEIERENPNWLLPVYHQSVQQLIDKKTRSSYEEAVHHLIELKRLYKKLGYEGAFTAYMKQLIQSTKRLRALQEALQKGKLTHD